MNPFQAIPANVRKWLYLGYGVAALVPTSAAAYDAAIQHVAPPWVAGVGAVLTVIGGALGFTAAANVAPTEGD